MSWNDPLPGKLSLILSILLGVSGIVLIGMLHKAAMQDEPLWAEGEKAVVWEKDQIPLRVCSIGDLGPYQKSLEVAVKTFDAYARFNVVRMAEDDCDITIEEGAIEVGSDYDSAFATSWLRPEPQLCVIKIHQPGNTGQVAIALMHEFGHCLGLTHDGFTASLMHINVTEFVDAPRPPILTERDWRGLQERYK